MKRLTYTWLLLVLLFLSACSEPAPSGLGVLAVKPQTRVLLFSNVPAGQSAVSTILLYNTGTTSLTISSMKITGGQKRFSLTKTNASSFVVEPGVVEKISVQYMANTAEHSKARLVLSSPDAANVNERGEFVITLQYRPTPTFIDMDCQGLLSFGMVHPDNPKTLSCTLSNTGELSVTYTKALFFSETVEKQHFDWIEPSFPFTLQAKQKNKVVVKIRYKPPVSPFAKDEGRFFLTTEKGIDSLALRVRGTRSQPLLQVLTEMSCSSDTTCRSIDPRLHCKPIGTSGKHQCQTGNVASQFLRFGLTSVGKSRTQRIRLRSAGKSPLKIHKISGIDSTAFSLQPFSKPLPWILQPGEEVELWVRYAPQISQIDKAFFFIESNSRVSPRITVELTADYKHCFLWTLPVSRRIKFVAAKSVRVDLFNGGLTPCQVDSVGFEKGKYWKVAPEISRPFVLLPGRSKSFLVSFFPRQDPKAVDKLWFRSADKLVKDISVELIAEIGGRKCHFLLSGPTFYFGNVQPGKSVRVSLPVSNIGYGQCLITSAKVFGTNPSGHRAFRLLNPPTFPITLANNQGHYFTIEYKPPLERAAFEGKVEIKTNDSVQNSLSIRLVGEASLPCLTLSVDRLWFGSSQVHCRARKKTIVLYHEGHKHCPRELTILRVSLGVKTTREFSIVFGPLTPFKLRQGQSLTYTLNYKPTSIGFDNGVFWLDFSDTVKRTLGVFLSGEGTSDAKQKDVFQQQALPKIDILLVIDDSSSIGDEQKNLAANMQTFLLWMMRLKIDYHIGVVTTDVSGRRRKPGCLRGTPRFVSPSTPGAFKALLKNIAVGTSGSGTERGLYAAYLALQDDILRDGRCNKGFLRKDAALSVLFFSDEEDQSTGGLDFYTLFLKSIKNPSQKERIRVSAIVGEPPSGCLVKGVGSASSGARYWQVSKSVGGVQASICDEKWSSKISNMMGFDIQLQRHFLLSRTPDVNTLFVLVNGKQVPQNPKNGWSFEAASNTLSFSGAFVPPSRAIISVQYKAVCQP